MVYDVCLYPCTMIELYDPVGEPAPENGDDAP